MSADLPYRSRAVRALVLLHEEHLRRFVQTWQLVVAAAVSLPPADDPAYWDGMCSALPAPTWSGSVRC